MTKGEMLELLNDLHGDARGMRRDLEGELDGGFDPDPSKRVKPIGRRRASLQKILIRVKALKLTIEQEINHEKHSTEA